MVARSQAWSTSENPHNSMHLTKISHDAHPTLRTSGGPIADPPAMQEATMASRIRTRSKTGVSGAQAGGCALRQTGSRGGRCPSPPSCRGARAPASLGPSAARTRQRDLESQPRGDRRRRLGPRHPASAGASRHCRRRARPQRLPRESRCQRQEAALNRGRDAGAHLRRYGGDDHSCGPHQRDSRPGARPRWRRRGRGLLGSRPGSAAVGARHAARFDSNHLRAARGSPDRW